MLTVISTDPANTQARWAAAAPGRLCVVQSRWSREQLEATRAEVGSSLTEWEAYGAGLEGINEECQPQITVQVVRVVPALVTWAATIPDDLVDVHPWLTPQRSSAPPRLA